MATSTCENELRPLAKHADKFAAATLGRGIWPPEDAPKMIRVAIWAFHGDQDQTVLVSGSRDIIAALKKAGVITQPRYTELACVGHGSCVPAYATSELWDGLFAQRHSVKPD